MLNLTGEDLYFFPIDDLTFNNQTRRYIKSNDLSAMGVIPSNGVCQAADVAEQKGVVNGDGFAIPLYVTTYKNPTNVEKMKNQNIIVHVKAAYIIKHLDFIDTSMIYIPYGEVYEIKDGKEVKCGYLGLQRFDTL